MRWNAKTDRNQAEIVAALRAAGASVRPVHRLGSGLPDLLVGYRGRNYLLEIKSPAGTLTPDEAEFFQSWRGHVALVHTINEALAAIGAIEMTPEEALPNPTGGLVTCPKCGYEQDEILYCQRCGHTFARL